MDPPLAPALLLAASAGLALLVALAGGRGAGAQAGSPPGWRPPERDLDALGAVARCAASERADPPLCALLGIAPRELRRLPGVGEARSVAIEREIWERAGPDLGLRRLSEVPGIGPATARRVGARIGAAPDP
jgi:hypothetical protein